MAFLISLGSILFLTSILFPDSSYTSPGPSSFSIASSSLISPSSRRTGTCHFMLRHDPFLCAHTVGDLLIVADDGTASLIRIQATNQGSQTITIKVIGRLVQDD